MPPAQFDLSAVSKILASTVGRLPCMLALPVVAIAILVFHSGGQCLPAKLRFPVSRALV